MKIEQAIPEKRFALADNTLRSSKPPLSVSFSSKIPPVAGAARAGASIANNCGSRPISGSVRARGVIRWVHQLARDPASPDLVRFSCAMTIYMTLLSGLVAMGAGMLLNMALLTGCGILAATVACVFYGLLHFHD